MNAISIAREALLAQLEPIAAKTAELKERLDRMKRTKAQLEAALKALTPTKKAKPKTPSTPTKPYARKPDIERVCTALIERNPSLTQEILKEQAIEKLAKQLGFNRNGLALQLDKYLNSIDASTNTNDSRPKVLGVPRTQVEQTLPRRERTVE